jgi:Reverse transcriptase (RNA-dependent DNA polymerase)
LKNYESRFRLYNGKWAYIQLDELAEAAKLRHIPLIRSLWRPPKYFYHLRRGGHVAALHLHKSRAWLGKFDLSSFFNRVTRQRLTRHLKSIGYSFRDAEDFAVASTVCVDHTSRRFALPYGFVQSPLLASLALDKSELGRCLNRLDRRGVRVTVYVDDIIVSCNDKEEVREALLSIRAAATESHFPINEVKSAGPLRSLHAFNVELRAGELEILADRFDEMCEVVLQNGPGPISTGILTYVQSISQSQADGMLEAFPQAFADALNP